MTPRPTLQTERLILRPFDAFDSPGVRLLAGDERIARFTLNIPHPYEPGMAEAWIDSHQAAWDAGKAATFAIVRRCDDALAGAIGLGIEPDHHRAEMGYWVGVRYWHKGYCTEAAEKVLRFGFEVLELHRIHACHFAENPASGRVMAKIGMRQEGVAGEHVFKHGEYHDLVQYAILKEAWLAQQSSSSK